MGLNTVQRYCDTCDHEMAKWLQQNSAQIPKFCYTNIAFSLKTHWCRRHICACATKFLHHLGTGCCLPKTTFRTKIEGGWARGASKNLGPLCISATVEASNFKFGTQLGFGTCLTKNNVLDQNWRGCGPGEHPKNWDPLRIFATVEASNFKFGTQIMRICVDRDI